MHQLVFLDADETLWFTQEAIGHGLLQLLSDVEDQTGVTARTDDRLFFIRDIALKLADRMGQTLSFGPILLAHVVARHLTGLSLEAVLTDPNTTHPDIDETSVAERFNAHFLHGVPALREGVIETLQALKDMGATVYILTETPLKRAQNIAATTGVGRYVDGIIAHPKTPELYSYLMSTLSDKDKPPVMVGDQLDKDVDFANKAGFVTVYIKGNFNPPWALSEDDVTPHHKIESFGELAAIVRDGIPASTAIVIARPARKKSPAL